MMEARTRSRSYEDVLRQRRIPAIYVVDDDGNVVNAAPKIHKLY